MCLGCGNMKKLLLQTSDQVLHITEVLINQSINKSHYTFFISTFIQGVIFVLVYFCCCIRTSLQKSNLEEFIWIYNFRGDAWEDTEVRR